MKNNQQIPRVFLDSNVIIAGLVFPRWPYEILRYGANDEIKIVVCPIVLQEVRKRIVATFPASLNKFDLFIEKSNYEVVPNPKRQELERYPDLLQDIKDIPIALAAIKAKVDYLISSDKHFTDKNPSTKQLRNHLKVLLPGTFLKEVMNWTSEELEAIRNRTWRDFE